MSKHNPQSTVQVSYDTDRRRETSIRASMLKNMLMVIALFGIVTLSITLFGADKIAKSMSKTLIGQTIDRTQAEVKHFIEPVDSTLNLLSRWIQVGKVNLETRSGIVDLLIPVLNQQPALFAVLLVSPDESTLLLSRQPSGWRARVYNQKLKPGIATSWYPGQTLPESEQSIDYDPQQRPWYLGAQQSTLGETFWTDAYRFFESQFPGITASRRIQDQQGNQWTIGLDVLLEDISEFTRELDVGYDGLMLLTDQQGQILGLPNLPQFREQQARSEAYLLRPHELNVPLAASAAKAFQPKSDGTVSTEPVRFKNNGVRWWGQGRWIVLSPNQELWVGVLISEAKILGSIRNLAWVLICIVVFLTALAVYRTITLSRRYSRPIRELADQSLRISTGDLRENRPIRSSLSEVTRLANAHESMRLGLGNLLKLEDDLQLARQIQQNTFPQHFPICKRFEVTAGSRPADATGGDTFDVIGVRRRNGRIEVAEQMPEQIYLLLADATGHGVGPALTASQVRAMFRMGVRLGRQINEIASEMNNQLKSDVHAGRFVTAWLGQLDSGSIRLNTLSSGQAPIIVYRKSIDQFEQMSADGPPLGVVSSHEHAQPNDISLASGDIVAVLSDGVLEARGNDAERFGVERTLKLIHENRTASAEQIMQAIKDAVDDFMPGSADDDQTGIIIKCR